MIDICGVEGWASLNGGIINGDLGNAKLDSILHISYNRMCILILSIKVIHVLYANLSFGLSFIDLKNSKIEVLWMMGTGCDISHLVIWLKSGSYQLAPFYCCMVVISIIILEYATLFFLFLKEINGSAYHCV